MKDKSSKFRIGAVSYLNTVPLVWGMLHGDQRERVDLSFSIPSECASQVEAGDIDIGLVPVAEVVRQGLEIVPGVGIACLGAVRSILLFSRVPIPQVRTLAADASSRTSVQLARVVLRERYGATPKIIQQQPSLESMLSVADAALIIGDPALRLNPNDLPYEWLDLGTEWLEMTGLPMVFAAWAGPAPAKELADLTAASYESGRHKLNDIVESEYQRRGISKELADVYLRGHIHYPLGPTEMEGLRAFIRLADLKEQNAYATTSL